MPLNTSQILSSTRGGVMINLQAGECWKQSGGLLEKSTNSWMILQFKPRCTKKTKTFLDDVPMKKPPLIDDFIAFKRPFLEDLTTYSRSKLHESG